ncbi:MAG: PD-(D/E)XK nuclease family protein [Flaviflexus sp.]|uniref:PD-(D/E)XK nuclease family protein n=1 Tax=Flaviflexus sp. TaxID=1969482 RepID=UPI00352FDE1B
MGKFELDASQARAVAHALENNATIIEGASGTGKTAVLLDAASQIIERGESLVLLAAGRKAADDLRTQLTLNHGKLPANVQVRTAQAWAFSILQTYAADRGRHTPELITGPTQDSIITELLTVVGQGIAWPSELDEDVMRLPGFRAELRDLLTRSAELGLSGEDLQALGREQGEQIWVAAGQPMDQYENSLALEDATAPGGTGADRFDHARLVHQAARLLTSPEAWGSGSMPTYQWVLIDDYQNATLATAALLSAVHDIQPGDRNGARLILTADPDTAVEGFRGGIAHLPGLARGSKPGTGLGAGVVTLKERHRGGEKLSELQNRLVDRISVAGLASHRRPKPGTQADSLKVLTFPGTDQEYSGIARLIRRAHVRDNLACDDVAIITRSRGTHIEIERVLRDAGVRVRPAARNEPLRFTPIVRALMDVMKEGVSGDLTDAELLALISSPLIGLDPARKRQLSHRITVWGEENESSSPVRDILANVPEGAEWAGPLKKLDEILEATRDAVTSNKNAEEVLWAAWQATDLADGLREQALSNGTTSRAANAILDAVMQLFRIAQRLVDRDARTSAAQLLDELESQDIAEDSIARTGKESGVHLLTPAMALGQEFELVIVADLNDGTWPNMKVRDGLFGAGRIAELYLDRLTDGVSGLRSVVDDELRMLAFSVARSKRDLVLTAVDSEETSRSRFIDLVVDEENIEHVESSKLSMSIPGVVGRLRSALTDPALAINDVDRELAADILASLPTWTERHLAGVATSEWIPSLEPSDMRPWESTKRISPSNAEAIMQCTLKWFAQRIGLSNMEATQNFDRGNIIHELAETYPDGDSTQIWNAFEEKWPEYSVAFTEGYERELERNDMVTMVEALIAYLSAHPGADVEKQLTYQTDHFTVSGRVDRVEPTPDGPIIADLKTGKTKPSDKDTKENAQLRIYQWMYEKETGVPTAGAKLVLVRYQDGRKKTGYPLLRNQKPLEESDEQAVEEMLKEVATKMGGIDITAQSGDWCAYCPIKTACPIFPEGALFS